MVWWRRCCGCKKNRGTVPGLGAGMWFCDKCARSYGIFGSKPRNVADKESAKWRAKPCSHSSVSASTYRKNGRNWYREICRRCGVTVCDAIVS